MANWLTYIKERFPLPVYFLLVGGISLSGTLLAVGEFETTGFLLSFIGNFAFFFILRLMDELKDYEKDLIVHPQRPLPRGLLTPVLVSRTINRGVLAMIAYAIILIFTRSWQVGVNELIVTGWLWFMYKEFYTSGWLADRPLLYAITHQVILLPVCSFAVLANRPDMLSAPSTWFFATAILGSFFSYEVCRKLDPKAHDLQKTYLATYGPWRTLILVCVLNAVAAVGAWASGLGYWLWPFEILTILTFFTLIAKPEKYKMTEAVATLSLLFHIWGMSFAYFYNFFVRT
jgi:hypothetical protein